MHVEQWQPKQCDAALQPADTTMVSFEEFEQWLGEALPDRDTATADAEPHYEEGVSLSHFMQDMV